MVFVGDSNGIIEFQGNTSTGALTFVKDTSNFSPGFDISSLAISNDGSLLYGTDPVAGSFRVWETASLDLVGEYTRSSFPSAPSETLAGASAVTVSLNDQYLYVVGAETGTLTVLAREESKGSLTVTFNWVQTLQDGSNGARGLTGATGIVASTDGKYVYVTSSTSDTLAIYAIGSDGGLVLDQVIDGTLGLFQPSGLAVDAANDNVYVASQVGNGSGDGGLASSSRPRRARRKSRSLSLSYNAMPTLDLNLGNAENTIDEENFAPIGTSNSNPTTLTINPGAGASSINLASVAGNTTVADSQGTGPISVTVNATYSSTNLTITGGSGDNDVVLDAAGTGNFDINLGNGNSQALIEGTALSGTKPVSLNGGTGDDVLYFDSLGNPFTAYNFNGTKATNNTPQLPDGRILANGHDQVTYTDIASIPGYVGATVSAGTYTPITENEPLTLSGSVIPATNSTILRAAWDLAGRRHVCDPGHDRARRRKAPTRSRPRSPGAQLVAADIDQPGTYPIALQVDSNSNTATAFASVVVQPLPPSVTVTPAPTATAGMLYTLNFSGHEAAGVDYSITGWSITWGDGPTSTLPSGATSATHTFATAGSPKIAVTATDPYMSTTVDQSVTVSYQPSVSADGPYTIQTGQSLLLTATASGVPSKFVWYLQGTSGRDRCDRNDDQHRRRRLDRPGHAHLEPAPGPRD